MTIIFWRCLTACILTVLAVAAASAQVSVDDRDLVDRPIAEIRFDGLQRVPEITVRNNIRSAVGEPFDPAVVRSDLGRLNRLGQFRFVEAAAQLRPDGSVTVLFRFTEQAIIAEIQTVGNRLVPDSELLAVVPLVPGGPRDDFLIQNARRAMEDIYRKRGHYLTTVTVNEAELQRAGLLIFQINEGPRVKVRVIEFQGNDVFDDDQLHAEIATRTAVFLFRRGELDEEILADDVATIDRYYKDRGYLDVRVDREIQVSPDGTEAKIIFIVAEGLPYRLRHVRTSTLEGGSLTVFAPEQIAAIMEIKPGDVFTTELVRRSMKAIQDSYGLMGYMLSEDDRRDFRAEGWGVIVRPTVLRVEGQQQLVDILIEIHEGRQYSVGEVQIQGNFLTRDNVIRRELREMTPGRPFDVRGIELAEERLTRTRLFNLARVTVQREDPDEPDYRDVLVEIKERQTGSVNFGVAVGSDSGVFGEFSVNQSNFDILDAPESLSELLLGRAFRGAGQRFNATLRPGTELFQFVVSWTEPRLLDSDYALSLGGQFRDRFYRQYDERRFGGTIGVGRMFGDVWSATVRSRIENIELTDIDEDAPTEVFLDAGPDWLTTLGVSMSRTTIPFVSRPGTGNRFEISYDRYGALGGDINFNLASAEYTTFFTIDEDFLGRLTTLRLNSRVGYIFGGRAPTYERFYMGGRSFRGFDYRTIGPTGIAADTLTPTREPVGGTWMIFNGAQFEFPLLADAITGVLFADSGTVTDTPGFHDYRLSVGLGFRLYIPQFGPTPLAFDFGFPIIKESRDREQVFSFSADFPF